MSIETTVKWAFLETFCLENIHSKSIYILADFLYVKEREN